MGRSTVPTDLMRKASDFFLGGSEVNRLKTVTQNVPSLLFQNGLFKFTIIELKRDLIPIW